MRTGVQFRRTLPARRTVRYFTFGWPEGWHVTWTVVPTTPERGAPQIDWDVEVERANDDHITYWISVENMTNEDVQIEGRYAVLN
jgi:hypothetical protein